MSHPLDRPQRLCFGDRLATSLPRHPKPLRPRNRPHPPFRRRNPRPSRPNRRRLCFGDRPATALPRHPKPLRPRNQPRPPFRRRNPRPSRPNRLHPTRRSPLPKPSLPSDRPSTSTRCHRPSAPRPSRPNTSRRRGPLNMPRRRPAGDGARSRPMLGRTGCCALRIPRRVGARSRRRPISYHLEAAGPAGPPRSSLFDRGAVPRRRRRRRRSLAAIRLSSTRASPCIRRSGSARSCRWERKRWRS